MNRSIGRRKTMKNMYPDIIRVAAYDGNILETYDDIVIPTKTTASKYELGCTFSHVKAIITAYKNGDDGVLIFEDDIYDTYKSKWVKDINKIILNAPSDAECILLHCINPDEITLMLNMDSDYSKWKDSRWSSGAYYINKKGMRKIHDLCFNNSKINLDNNGLYAADIFIYSSIDTYNYTKPLFIHQIKESTIHQLHIKHIHIPAYNKIVEYFSSTTP